LQTLSKPAVGPFSKIERVIITVPVLMASLLHAVNMSTAYVALPNIQGNLSARPDQSDGLLPPSSSRQQLAPF